MYRRATPGLARRVGVVVWLVVGLSAMAQADTGRPQAAGDPAAGRVKFETCRGCHAQGDYRHAYPNYAVPRLGGQNRDYIVAALKAYRGGARENATMQAQALSLTDQDMRDIAAYLSAQKPAPP